MWSPLISHWPTKQAGKVYCRKYHFTVVSAYVSTLVGEKSRSLPVCGISRVVPVYFNCCNIIVSLLGFNLVSFDIIGSQKNQKRQKTTYFSPGTKTHIWDQSRLNLLCFRRNCDVTE